MTRFALTLAAAAFATSAFAGSSDYSPASAGAADTQAAATQTGPSPAPNFVISTKNEKTPYAYANPLGVGPKNDSR